MKDKIVIITGANSGIGKAAALKFATEEYYVIMACRNMETSTAVQNDIIEITKNTNVDLMELDVSSFDSIRAFCTAFTSKYPRLDILIHNAAYLNHGEKEYKLSPRAYRIIFRYEYIWPFFNDSFIGRSSRKITRPKNTQCLHNKHQTFLRPEKED